MNGLKNSKKNSSFYPIVLILFFGSLGLLFLRADFKVFMIGAFALFIILYAKTRNVFVSLFALLLTTAQFQLPGKYYTFELTPKGTYYFPGLPDGIIEGFGLIASDIVALALVLYLLRQLILFVVQKKWKNFISIKQNGTIKILFLCWLLYFSLSFFSSYQYSFFPEFSISVLLQYIKMPITFLCSLLLFNDIEFKKKLFVYIVCSLLLFQSVVGIWQVLSAQKDSSTISGTVIVAEENSLFSRAQGTFAYPNQFALTQVTLLLFLLPFALKRGNNLLRFSSVVTIISIMLSQSRTSWMILIVVFVTYVTMNNHYRKSLWSMIANIHPRVFFIILIVPLFVVIERLFASPSFFTDYGGGPLRISMIHDGLTLLADSPFSGYGVETSVRQLFDKVPGGYVQYFPFAIHFGFLQMTLESGLVATVFFFLPFYLSIRQYTTRLTKHFHADPLAGSATLGLIGILMYYSLHPIYGRVEFLYIGLLFGAALQYNEDT